MRQKAKVRRESRDREGVSEMKDMTTHLSPDGYDLGTESTAGVVSSNRREVIDLVHKRRGHRQA